jgi:hypothetical protein
MGKKDTLAHAGGPPGRKPTEAEALKMGYAIADQILSKQAEAARKEK